MLDQYKLPNFEDEIVRTLEEHNGPPELAAELVAIAQRHCLTGELKNWIRFHRGAEWAGAQFEQWCVKYLEYVEKLAEDQKRLDKWRRPE